MNEAGEQRKAKSETEREGQSKIWFAMISGGISVAFLGLSQAPLHFLPLESVRNTAFLQ